ncbi:CHAD domain-containing protein [Agrobacterium sp. rho-13.3]|uniref:CHAD domain-containing protein n=1 Tax=Agrobacterium sp. rho-13.3 TaxID=3072980 RepID=UPI002A168319|nr:CHAD domain-containing protein [Agrobacterium sp. rho-13.3]MDX8307649.1 CHAD domain-containing protein [Agrobacterium sp. rho-13.3]
MSFKVNPAKPFVEELKKVGVALIDEAVAALSQQPDGPHAAVHEARKKFKRLRALYRFTHNKAPDFRAAENTRFRDIARSLSAARDAAALVENISYLETFSRTDTERHALASVHETLAKRRDAMTSDDGDLPARIRSAIAECENGKQALQHLSLPHSDKTALSLITHTWRKQRQKALDALSACHTDAHDENFHDLRKSGQVYWIHLALLRRLWPSAMRAKKVDAKRLVDLLGHEHDLSVLAAFADREPDVFTGGDTLALLLDAILHRQQALRQECLELADHVFAESAKTESKIIGLLWKDAAG